MIFPCYFSREVNIQVTIFAGFAEVQAAQSTKNLKWLCGYLLLLVKKQESSEKKLYPKRNWGVKHKTNGKEEQKCVYEKHGFLCRQKKKKVVPTL